MRIDRRNFLRITGGGIVLAAGAAGGFLATRTPHEALAPWDAAGGYSEPRRRALSYAILAPNPHNRQPWEVSLDQDDRIVVWRDKTRNLPETDPYDRQLTIGMGCFLELLEMGLGETGHAAETVLFPAGDEGPVALLTLTDGGQPDPLFAHVMARRSCKEPFEGRPVPREMIDSLSSLATIHDQPETVEALKQLTWNAWMTESTTYRTMKESTDLFRLGKAEINANPDGIDLGGPMFETLMLFGLLTREGALDPASSEFRQVAGIYREMLMATPAYASIASEANTRGDQIAAGRNWLRLNLAATGMGLALHPVSQALQEYPEMKPHYRDLHNLIAKPGHTVQMLGRLGFGPETAITPRWPLESRITHGRKLETS